MTVSAILFKDLNWSGAIAGTVSADFGVGVDTTGEGSE